jgi:hypothetical protein
MAEDADFARQQQEAEVARTRQVAEMEARLAAQLAQVRQEVEAQIAAQQAEAQQDVQAELERRAAELASAEQAVAEAAQAVEAPSHLTSWQQDEVARQLQLAREAAEAARKQVLEPERTAPTSESTFGSPTSG